MGSRSSWAPSGADVQLTAHPTVDYSQLPSHSEHDRKTQQQNKEGAVYTATVRPTATGTHTEQDVRPIEEKEVAACHTRSGISSSNIQIHNTLRWW